MPKLTDEERAILAESDRLHKMAFESYLGSGPKYTAQYCRVCNRANNGRDLDEAVAANHRHEYGVHPALKEWDAYQRTHAGFRLSIKALHDHDCPEQFCECRCGCKVGPYCGIIGGRLCATCVIREGRGESEHGVNP